MQLIGQYDSPFVRRVGIALTLYGMEFEHLPFSSFGEWQKFAAHNPLRRVPALVLDHGEALIDSAAILDHLDERHGREGALIAPSGIERRAALRRIALATGVADKAVSFFYARLFSPALDPAFIERSEGQIRDGLSVIDAECAARERTHYGQANREQNDCHDQASALRLTGFGGQLVLGRTRGERRGEPAELRDVRRRRRTCVAAFRQRSSLDVATARTWRRT